MICTEKGLLPGSEYFFFSPSGMFTKCYYFLLNCGRFICRDGYHINRKGYISPLLIYVKSGELLISYEGRRYIAGKDEIVLMDCNVPHEYFCKSNCEFLYFHFDGGNSRQIANHLISQNGGAVFRLESGRNILDIMERILIRLHNEDHPPDTELSCGVYSILCAIQSFSEILPASPTPASSTVTSVINFIKSNVNENLTLDSLASHVNMSKYYLSRLFKKETGLSPMEYTAYIRINLAKTILKTTTRTVSDIALSLGYSSSSSFINSFTARVGISPNKYRAASKTADKAPY